MHIGKIRSQIRTLLLPGHLLSLLKKHKEDQLAIKEQLGGKYNDLNLVFPNKNGGIQSPSAVRARYNRLIEKSKVKS